MIITNGAPNSALPSSLNAAIGLLKSIRINPV
jgi:hypothetical protein